MSNAIKHARILEAYLTRMSSIDLQKIVNATAKSEHACWNLGASSQAAAREDLSDVIEEIIQKITPYDMGILEKKIEEAQRN